jgi:GT2 family glycosyltransferase
MIVLKHQTPRTIKPNYCIGVPTINRFDLLQESLLDIKENQPNVEVIIVDNGKQNIEPFLKEHGILYHLIENDFNEGVSGSWNQIANYAFYVLSYRAVWIVNDDIVLGKNENDILKFAEKCIFDNIFYVQDGTFGREHPTWCSFMLPERIFNQVGGFDEEIYPAYFEDNDFGYRLSLVGKNHVHISDLNPKVFRNSMTLAKDYSYNSNFEVNRAYYKRKWGGEPEQETFTTPFNK